MSAAQYTAIESSRMSGENGDGRHEFEATTRQPRRTDCEYTMLSQCTMVSPILVPRIYNINDYTQHKDEGSFRVIVISFLS